MDTEGSLFDEFGNYIGREEEEQQRPTLELGPEIEERSFEESASIVLHEDKRYYLSARETYGAEVEALVQDEDTQPLWELIIAPRREIQFERGGPSKPAVDNESFLVELMGSMGRIRNVAIMGALHHGKTSVLQMLASQEEGLSAGDTLKLEEQRGVSLRSTVNSMLLRSKERHYVMNLIDTPGHADFEAEQLLAMRMADGVLLVVDAAEGLGIDGSPSEERDEGGLVVSMIVRKAVEQGAPLVLLLNKVERLWMELKMPPADVYQRLRQLIAQVNHLLMEAQSSLVLDPNQGNVLFGSTDHGWVFSLPSFARDVLGGSSSLALWNNTLVRGKRPFVSHVLEPLIKVYTMLLSADGGSYEAVTKLERILKIRKQLGRREFDAIAATTGKAMLRLVLGRWLGVQSVGAVVEALAGFVSSPEEASMGRMLRYWQPITEEDSTVANTLAQRGDHAMTVCWAVRCIPRKKQHLGDGLLTFDILLHVLAGQVAEGMTLYSDEGKLRVSHLAVMRGSHRSALASVSAGNYAVCSIDGADEAILAQIGKTVTLFSVEGSFGQMRPLISQPLTRVAIEPVVPSELPRLVEGILALCRCSAGAISLSVSETGEHAICSFGGELLLDSALHDVRRLYAPGVELRLADPGVFFGETVADGSYLRCFARSPNGANQLAMLAEPLTPSVLQALSNGALPQPGDPDLAKLLRERHGWDLLAAKFVLAFGPDPRLGPNILIDDTLPAGIAEDQKELLREQKQAIIQGFRWATREGPLCEEPVRGVLFRLIDIQLSHVPVERSAAQLVPTVRRLCYSAMLTAQPRLLEPVLQVHVTAQKQQVLPSLYQVLAKRRGHVTKELPCDGTPMYALRALVPLLDSFGLETDLRLNSQGMAHCQSRFDHWQLVPGDPLDAGIKLIPLEPSPPPHLARDILLKTRRRKGLPEDVSLARFFDEAMLSQLR